MKYNPALDGLRAIAVLMVLEYHGSWHTLGWMGHLGVDVFFVLSGFLITGILMGEEAEGGIRLGQFYLRRARRLYPALCVLVVSVVAAGWISVGQAVGPLLYLSDYVRPPGELAHTWSLAVEEHFYLAWPLVLPVVMRMNRRRAIWLMVGAYFAATAWSLFTPWPWQSGYRFDTHMSGLIFGALAAMLPRATLLPFALAIGSYIALVAGWDYYRMFAEAITACVILLSYQMTVPFLTRAPFVYLGKISYGVYLYHWPIQGVVGRYLEGWTSLVISTVVTIACAAASFHTIEAWFRRPGTRRPALAHEMA